MTLQLDVLLAFLGALASTNVTAIFPLPVTRQLGNALGNVQEVSLENLTVRLVRLYNFISVWIFK